MIHSNISKNWNQILIENNTFYHFYNILCIIYNFQTKYHIGYNKTCQDTESSL